MQEVTRNLLYLPPMRRSTHASRHRRLYFTGLPRGFQPRAMTEKSEARNDGGLAGCACDLAGLDEPAAPAVGMDCRAASGSQ